MFGQFGRSFGSAPQNFSQNPAQAFCVTPDYMGYYDFPSQQARGFGGTPQLSRVLVVLLLHQLRVLLIMLYT